MDNTIELWQKRLEQQKSSGLNIREWCRQNHIAEKTYYKWRKAVSVSDTPDSNSVEFVPLNLPYDGDLFKKNTAHESEGITISVRNEHDPGTAPCKGKTVWSFYRGFCHGRLDHTF